jgi:hypothetical protein
MTWSIVAHDPGSGAFAVAVATRAFAVGAHCPYVRSGVGAIATQSITNRYLGPAILDLLARGIRPATAIKSALTADDGRHMRQLRRRFCSRPAKILPTSISGSTTTPIRSQSSTACSASGASNGRNEPPGRRARPIPPAVPTSM